MHRKPCGPGEDETVRPPGTVVVSGSETAIALSVVAVKLQSGESGQKRLMNKEPPCLESMGVIRTDLSIEAMVGFELEAAMGSLYEGRMLMKFGVLEWWLQINQENQN